MVSIKNSPNEIVKINKQNEHILCRYDIPFGSKKSIEKTSYLKDLNPEFDDYVWSSYWHPLQAIIGFKKEVYRDVLLEFCDPYIKRFV